MFNFFKQTFKSKVFGKIVKRTDRFRKDNKQIKDIPNSNLQMNRFGSPNQNNPLDAFNLLGNSSSLNQSTSRQHSNIPVVLPLAQVQEGMWFDCKLLPQDATSYNLSVIFDVIGEINIEVLKRAWDLVAQKHESLRVHIIENGDKAFQVVNPQVVGRLEAIKIQPSEKEQAIEKFLNTSFQITSPPLYKIQLVSYGLNSHCLLINFHHLIIDAKGIDVVIKDLSQYYNQILKEQDIEPPRQDFTLEYYLDWEKSLLTEKALAVAKSFWLQALSGNSLKVDLGLKHDAEKIKSKSIHFKLANQELKDLSECIKKEHSTFFITLTAVMGVVINRYFGQNSFSIGYPVNLRKDPFKDIVNHSVNLLPLPMNFKKGLKLSELLKNLKYHRKKARSFSYYTIRHIINDLRQSNPEEAYLPNFQISEVPTNLNNLILDGTLTGDTKGEGAFNNTDLFLSYYNHNQELSFEVIYNASAFSEQFIKQFISSYKLVLREISKNPEQIISLLPILTEDERKTLLVDWNQTEREYPEDKTIHQLFEEQVEKTPDNIAVVFAGEKLTYKELNEKANRLVCCFRDIGLKSNDLVAISLERSINFVVSILATLKCGAAYIGLSTKLPKERVRYLLINSNAKLLLTNRETQNSQFFEIPTYNIEDFSLDNGLPNNFCAETSNKQLAYVIYTSGTTGAPKGISIEHSSLVNLATWHQRQFKLTEQDRCTQYADISFDASVWEIFPPLITGASLYIIPEDYKLVPEDLNKYFISNGITVGFLPTVICEQFMDIETTSLRVLLTGGDKLTKYLPRSYELYNCYGPSETSVVATSFLINPNNNKVNIYIGKPIDNIKTFILDKQLQPVPVGIIGELYIGGVSLARGYLNLPELTVEHFIKNPFGSGKLYKTGDLVRYLPDGNIEYVGRADSQVKLRGFRIELGEIEAILQSNSDIFQAVVVLREDEPNNKYLAAYVVAKAMLHKQEHNDNENNTTMEQQKFIKELKEYLTAKLPNYMVPNSFTLMEKLPLNINGKVDRKALPKPDFNAVSGYIAPRNNQEKELVNIWNKILGVQKIGITDNFFSLGGNSLSIIKIANEIKAKFKIELPIKSLFKALTIEDLVKLIEDKSSEYKKLNASLKVMLKPEHVPLSFAQERLWFLAQLIPNSSMYNMFATLKLKGGLNIQALQKAFEDIISRHESLRTTFKEYEGNIYQNISDNCNFNLDYKDLSYLDERSKEDTVQALIRKEAFTPFTLNQGSLLRASIVKINHNEHILLFNMHHIISDGWSLDILFKELSKYYNDFVQNKEPTIAKTLYQYSDFSIWQREYLSGDLLNNQIKYWQQELQNIPEILELPLDRARNSHRTYQGNIYSYQLPKETLLRLKALSQSQNVSMFMTMLSIFQVLLHRYSNQETVVVGTPIANRHISGTEELIGFFVNTLAIRMDSTSKVKFTEVLMQIKQRLLNAQENQDLPFEQVVEHLKIERRLERQPVFQVMFIMDEWQLFEEFKLNDLKINLCQQTETIAKFDLTLNIKEYDQYLELNFEYAVDIFNKETIKRMARHFEVLTNGILKHPAEEIAKLPLLSQEEITQQLVEWNKTETEYPENKTIHKLFEEQAERTPNNIAVVFEEAKITYIELNQKANQLAHLLREQGVGPDTSVGIYLDRSQEIVIAILGILKAGGAYVPIDVQCPKERFAYIINETKMCTILTQKKYRGLSTNSIYLDTCAKRLDVQPVTNPTDYAEHYHLAYVIYTSGSTGKPKGVQISHQAICNHMAWMIKEFNFDASEKILQKTAYTFDASVWEFFLPLLIGGQLIIAPPNAHYEPVKLMELLRQHEITTVQFVPSMFDALSADAGIKECKTLNRIFVGGEVLRKQTVELCKQKLPAVKIYNLYGPTEATIDTSVFECKDLVTQSCIPIGRPIYNIKYYVLDNNLQPLPIMCVGELYIGGVGLSRGYLNRPELTAERFIVNPFQTEKDKNQHKNSRLYKTGDLVRYLLDGNIEYIGRADFQIKLRGFRIELGDIEAVLQNKPDVLQAAVIFREDEPDNKYLAAYVVPKAVFDEQKYDNGKNNKTLEQKFINELKRFLTTKLPRYMVPSSFTLMKKLPLNVSGKIDRKALPKPNRVACSHERIAPNSLLEQKLALLWSEVLRTDANMLSITDNFFDCGGNSILISKLNQKISLTFNVKIPLAHLFNHPNIENMAKIIDLELLRYALR